MHYGVTPVPMVPFCKPASTSCARHSFLLTEQVGVDIGQELHTRLKLHLSIDRKSGKIQAAELTAAGMRDNPIFADNRLDFYVSLEGAFTGIVVLPG
jgi:hypothetical protein